ncbi:hypothetical protein JXA85_02250 [Candidatus Woesearchaeota archaeon]|nr:hypothetical protein [Candidatus Woesearchaeota archaeon]
MKFRNLLKKYQEEKTGLFVNGYGIGKITSVEDDYIDYEVIKKQDKKLIKEIMHIQIQDIEISLGEKEIPKSQEQKEIENDLEAI